MLTTHVFPEFTSQHGFLRARVSASGRFLERQGSMAKPGFSSHFGYMTQPPESGFSCAVMYNYKTRSGGQWFSGRVLDSRPRGHGFEPHRRYCVVSLSKNINPSLVLVQPRKTRPFITERC